MTTTEEKAGHASTDASGRAFTPPKAKLEPEIGWSRNQLAARAGRDIPDGSYVNLGIGVPQLIADNLPEGIEVWTHSENGILGIGGVPDDDHIDPDVGDSGKRYATVLPGAALFDSSMSFAIIRGGHLDLTALGALEVAPNGDLANWYAPGRPVGVGGAMDLVMGAKQVWVLSLHSERSGKSKMVPRCTLPLTGAGIVKRVYTNLGVFLPKGESFECIEIAPGVTRQQIVDMTDAPITFGDTAVEVEA